MMTTSDLRKKISESNNANWYNELDATLHSPIVKFKQTFNGLSAVFDFLTLQEKGYASYNQALPDEIKQERDSIHETLKAIEQFLNTRNTNINDWNWQVVNRIERLKFIYNSPVTEFLIKVFNEHPNQYQGAFEYFVLANLSHTNNKDYFIGYLLAYEFSMKENSDIVNRKDAETRSIARIRNDFEKTVDESKRQFMELLSDVNNKAIEFSQKIDGLVLEKDQHFKTWYEDTCKEYASFYSASSEKVAKLEELYREKLKLEAPAKYWNNRAAGLQKEGRNWLYGLIASIAVAVFILIWVLSKTADGTIEKIFQNTGTAIKWSVVLIMIVSFLAFAIRIFSKLTFSCFHLVRDAEEREQLTYVYLALKNEKSIDDTERHLIMQSLFSRADSGLLKEDASPTMPGNIVDKLMTK